jgi:hypothetical protein
MQSVFVPPSQSVIHSDIQVIFITDCSMHLNDKSRLLFLINIGIERSEKPGHISISFGLIELDLSSRIDT